MMNEVTMNRAAFVAGAGALACALAGCSGGLGGAGGAKAASTADAACVDDNANVTVYAAINLGGADLVRLLKHQNYEWQGENVGYGAVDDAGFSPLPFPRFRMMWTNLQIARYRFRSPSTRSLNRAAETIAWRFYSR